MRRLAPLAGLLLAALLTGCGTPRAAPAENPLTADLLSYRNALALLKEGRADEAIQILKRAREAYPKDPNVTNALGLALLYKKDYLLALKAFKECLVIDATFVEARNNSGVTLMEMGRLDDAEKEFQAVLDSGVSKERLNAHFNIGLVRGKKGQWADAEREFSLVVAEDPKYTRAYRERGLARVQTENFRAALEDLLRYLRDEADDPAANYNAALCLLTTGRRDVASRYMERVIQVAPDSEEAGKARRFLAGERTGLPHLPEANP